MKIFFGFCIGIFLLVSSSFSIENIFFSINENLSKNYEEHVSQKEPQYYVVVAWEYIYNKSHARPVVSNIVYVDCEYHSSLSVINSFNAYYDAYYRKDQGTTGINREVGFAFDTEDKAIAHRRKLIADYNWNWDPLIINYFKATC